METCHMGRILQQQPSLPGGLDPAIVSAWVFFEQKNAPISNPRDTGCIHPAAVVGRTHRRKSAAQL